jgi:hypothetical protein
MKKLFTKLALGATTVAVSAGTLTMSAGAASAAVVELPDNLRVIALHECANPTWTDGKFDAGIPVDLDVNETGTSVSADGHLVADWATVYATTPTGAQLECYVAQIKEPEELKNAKDSKATLELSTIGGVGNIAVGILNRTFDQVEGLEKFALSLTDRTVGLGDVGGVQFVDHDNDPTTPRVVDFGAHLLDGIPASGIAQDFAVAGQTETTETTTTSRTVTVERTPAEKAAALKTLKSEDKKDRAAHTKASKKLSKAKSAERSKVKKSKVSAKAKKTRLAKIDKKYKAKKRTAANKYAAARKANKADYQRAIAPYDTKVTDSSQTVTRTTPYNGATRAVTQPVLLG